MKAENQSIYFKILNSVK